MGKEQWEEPRNMEGNENGYLTKKWKEPKCLSLLKNSAEGQP